HPDFPRCAFGAGAGCRPCPVGAMCPGGARAWTLPGYYTPSEASGVVFACAPPASQRCVGWDGVQQRTACGAPRYAAGSYACRACGAGSYALPTDECVACPATAGSGDAVAALLIPVAEVIGGLLAFAVAAYAALLAVAKVLGGTLAGGA